MKNSKLKDILLVIAATLIIIACVIITVVITSRPLNNKDNNDNEINTTEDIYNAYSVPIIKKEIDWKALKERSENVYAWIYIPGTAIDYPIVQHPTELSFYLTRDIDGTDSDHGSIFTDYYNSTGWNGRNTVVYGRNMEDGSMFATLHNYENKDFFDKNQYIYIYTPEDTIVYQVYAAYNFNDDYIPLSYNMVNNDSFKEYLDLAFSANGMTDHSRKDSIKPVDALCHIITLSTGIKGQEDRRWIVQGVRLN